VIVYEGDLAEKGAHPSIVDKAQRVEDFAIELMATEVRVFVDSVYGRVIITTDQSYRDSGDIITTVKELDL
jgi:hypothetical protein